jgi:hypothetical protein
MLTQITKTTKVTSENFNTFTKAQKRVILAKEVLNQLKLKTISPKMGSYIRVSEKSINKYGAESLQTCVLNGKVKCQVCAEGSLLLAYVLYKNKLNVGEFVDDFDIAKRLKGIFSKQELDLIEAAFEKKDFAWTSNKLEKAQIKSAIEFGKGFNRGERIKRIMQSIIDNNGKVKF